VEPAGAIPFRLGPRGRARHEFVLKIGEGTYNAHYPVRVYVEFEDQGQKLTTHPVLILETKTPDLPRPKPPAEWKPVRVPAGGMLGLWRMPVRREQAEIANFGAEAGRTGREVFDAGSVVTYGALGGGQGRDRDDAGGAASGEAGDGGVGVGGVCAGAASGEADPAGDEHPGHGGFQCGDGGVCGRGGLQCPAGVFRSQRSRSSPS